LLPSLVYLQGIPVAVLTEAIHIIANQRRERVRSALGAI
jgi:hypothetical protein